MKIEFITSIFFIKMLWDQKSIIEEKKLKKYKYMASKQEDTKQPRLLKILEKKSKIPRDK